MSIILFHFCFWGTVLLVWRRLRKIKRNILLGQKENIKTVKVKRWQRMIVFALFQKKMFQFSWAGFFHSFIYVGFILFGIELIEILIDGLFGQHRVFKMILGSGYGIFVWMLEIVALAVILACIVFLMRRNIFNIKRFISNELRGQPKNDANIILVVEILLMSSFLLNNAANVLLHFRNVDTYSIASLVDWDGCVLPSLMIFGGVLDEHNNENVMFVEKIGWWIHILGIFGFMIYIPYSKHFHIVLAFINSYFSTADSTGKIRNSVVLNKITKKMINNEHIEIEQESEKFGAKDATDLSWRNLLAAYSCSECGRCTERCPANITGKLLSPRKIVMTTRDRIEEIGKGKNLDKTLLDGYISEQELMACTTCLACVEACPILINPLDIIMQLRWGLVMDESRVQNSLNTMLQNIENNGTPWQFSTSQREAWTKTI